MKQAAYCGTRNIYNDMETSAKSLIANSDVERVHFIIEDSEFPRELPSIIHVHDVSGQTFFKPDGPNMASQFTWMAMMRIALCHVLPNADKVLSLDADTIAMKDVSDIWDLPLDDNYFAASEEWHRTVNGLQYCNHGVVLYNLDKLRDGKADECIEVLNKRKYQWVEQDVVNYLCQGRIYPMPTEYNSNWWTDKKAPDPAIKHYAGKRHCTWCRKPEVEKWRNASWNEVLRLHG